MPRSFSSGGAAMMRGQANLFAVHRMPEKESCCEDMEPTDADKKAVRLLKKHQAAIYAEFHRTLDSRPKTLTHGDMRADNMFRRKDGSGFTVIDWQTYGAAPPGVEMHQLFANQIDDH